MNVFKLGFKTMGSVIVAAIISFFLCISLNVICSGAFTREIGYDAFVYESKTAAESIAKYEYIYTDTNGDGVDDGVDTKRKEYEDKGYFVDTVAKRSSLTGIGKAMFFGSTQVLSAIMIVAFASNGAYKQGSKDNNLVKISHIKKDMLKGFKIGLIANIPFFLILVISIVTAADFRTAIYATLNSHYYGIIRALCGESLYMSEIGVLRYVLIALAQFIVPIISGIAYILGLSEINLGEKIVYKKEGK